MKAPERSPLPEGQTITCAYVLCDVALDYAEILDHRPAPNRTYCPEHRALIDELVVAGADMLRQRAAEKARAA